ncbi:hypothetical protein [Bradyrhizobium ottawaense]|uniref:hypothetical protein n=1 Tax=Bradyrhizobium ottawaense TaxID=931866 RepID=UPI00347034A1
MKTPSSPHFTPVDLKRYFNAERANAGEGFAARPGDTGWIDSLRGLQTHRGMPFLFGSEIGPDVLELRPGAPPAVIALPPTMASYVLFVQVAADRPSASPEGFGEIGPATLPVEGNPLGDRVATYGLRYADGSETDVPVLRRFAIQQNHISWSASAFAALPLRAPIVHASTAARTLYSAERRGRTSSRARLAPNRDAWIDKVRTCGFTRSPILIRTRSFRR